jgi:hypothetical protein
MQTLDLETGVIPAVVGGGSSSLFIQYFGLQPEVLLMAAIGSFIGVMMRNAVPEFDNNRKAFGYFCRVLAIVFAGTIMAAWVVPLAMHYQPDLAQNSVAGIIAFLVVYFSEEILQGLKYVIVEGFKLVVELLKRIMSFKFGKGNEQ